MKIPGVCMLKYDASFSCKETFVNNPPDSYKNLSKEERDQKVVRFDRKLREYNMKKKNPSLCSIPFDCLSMYDRRFGDLKPEFRKHPTNRGTILFRCQKCIHRRLRQLAEDNIGVTSICYRCLDWTKTAHSQSNYLAEKLLRCSRTSKSSVEIRKEENKARADRLRSREEKRQKIV